MVLMNIGGEGCGDEEEEKEMGGERLGLRKSAPLLCLNGSCQSWGEKVSLEANHGCRHVSY